MLFKSENKGRYDYYEYWLIYFFINDCIVLLYIFGDINCFMEASY